MNKKKTTLLIIYTFLVSIILLGFVFITKLFPMVSFGSDTTSMTITNELEKYINYNLSEENKGTLVQYGVTTKIEYGEETLPVEESQITVNLSKIEEKYPYEVKVISENNFENTAQYNSTTGILSIYTNEQKENVDNNYSIICYYDTYTDENVERDLSIGIEAKSIFSAAQEKFISKEEQFEHQVTEKIGELTSINYKEQKIYNGYIKSNFINKTDYVTSYGTIEQIMISKKEAQNTIELKENAVLMKQEEELANNNHLIYKSTQIQKRDIDNILGEEGSLEILNEKGEIIATINKETQFDENGIYTVNYENEPKEINIRTSQVINEGIFNITHTKEIKGNLPNIQELAVKTSIQINEAENVYEFKNDIKDSITRISTNIDNLNWSNKNQNEVTFNINLEANTIQDNMFKNPYIRIELPNEVEKVILGESHLVYANNLQLQTPYIETNENGNQVIVVNLTGTQTEYNEYELGLVTNIKIPATIILKKDIEKTTEENLNIAYANQYTVDNNYEINNEEVKVHVENYKEEQPQQVNTVYNVTQQILAENSDGLLLEVEPTKATIELKDNDIVYEGEYIKYNIKVTNASSEDMQDVKIQADIPEGVTYGELYAEYYQYVGAYKYNFEEGTRQKTFELGTIPAGETVTTYYEVKANDLGEEEQSKQISTNISAYIGDGLAKTYEMANTIEKADVEMFLGTYNDLGGWTYWLNLSSTESKEVTAKIHLPKELKLETIYYIDHTVNDLSEFKATEEDHGITVYTDYGEELQEKLEQIRDLEIDISEDNVITTRLQTNRCYSFIGNIEQEKLEKTADKSTVELNAYAEIESNHTYLSNENRISVAYQNVTVSMTSPTEGETLKYEDEVEYNIELKNIGKYNVSENQMYNFVIVNILDFIPEGIDAKEVIYDTWIVENPKDERRRIRSGRNDFVKARSNCKRHFWRN